MREVREFNKSYILISALYIVLGVVFLTWPSLSVQMICYLLGIAMLVLGITYVILFFTRDTVHGLLSMDLVIGIVAAAFGAFVLLNQEFIGTILPFAMGIVLLLGAVIKLQNAISMKRLKLKRWYIVLIFAILLGILGAVLLVNPFPEEHQDWMIMYTGICLILDGLVNLVSMAFIVGRMKRLRKLQRQHPEREVTPEDLLNPPPPLEGEYVEEPFGRPMQKKARQKRPLIEAAPSAETQTQGQREPSAEDSGIPDQQKDEAYTWTGEAYDWTEHPERWKDDQE